jgi:hypothetical protein
MKLHEIQSTVIFHVAAFGGLGSSPDSECIAVKLRFEPGEWTDRRLSIICTRHRAANSKHNATDSWNLSGNSGRIRAGNPWNCA